MQTADYWMKRAEMLIEQGLASADEVIDDLERLYRNAGRNVDYEIKRLYERYADEYGLTYANAVREVTSSEYKEWRMTLAEYVERINETGDDTLLRELNILSTRSRATRWQQVETAIKVNASELATKQEALLRDLLGDQYQNAYYRQIFDIQQGLGYGNTLEMLSSRRVAEVISYPWSGANYSERVWRNRDALTNNLRDTLTEGLIQGADTKQMARRIRDSMDVSMYRAETLVRTETAHVIEQGTMDGYGEAGIEEYEILATLDRRTSRVCQQEDGKRYMVSEATEGKNMPPFHPNCRTTTVPVIPEDDSESLRAAQGADGERILVPADMTYDQWYDHYVTQATAKDYEATVRGVTATDGLMVQSVSAHAIDQAIARKVPADAVRQALTEPLDIGKIKVDAKGRRSKRYVGEQATVAINPDTGVVASLNPTHSKTVKKLKAKKGD